MSWTDERVELLKNMWGEGRSASQIAKELGGVTRNAVIGKVHRLGLSNRATPAKATKEKAAAKEAAKPKAKPKAAPAAPKSEEPISHTTAVARALSIPPRKPIITAGKPLPPQPSTNEISQEALANVAVIEKKAKKLTLMELTERTCKWPIGDPATDEFWFCGLGVMQGKPYCEAHNAVAFQPMSARRDRRR